MPGVAGSSGGTFWCGWMCVMYFWILRTYQEEVKKKKKNNGEDARGKLMSGFALLGSLVRVPAAPCGMVLRDRKEVSWDWERCYKEYICSLLLSWACSSRHLLPLNWETLRVRNTVSPVLTVYPDDNLVTQVMQLVLEIKRYSREDTVSEMCIRVTSVNHMT